MNDGRDLRHRSVARGGSETARDLWAIHVRSLQRGERPVVPATVLGQAWRGGPQGQLSRLLRGCRIEDLDEKRARAAGVAALVVTSDPDDLQRIAGAIGLALRLHRV